jgi:hypothetical protein
LASVGSSQSEIVPAISLSVGTQNCLVASLEHVDRLRRRAWTRLKAHIAQSESSSADPQAHPFDGLAAATIDDP